ncbi:hypothetical protein BU25DRAFT_405374 [Macroventuria anomochaeta]|uniref:Uncharacterized protein n=1 Tax=Macroventuria anomochaeta TaxID=301207 RepID=A0ACB6SGS3_9PLEO|nr:uncharacterized protein BU25DRAFT_405374 [Macroventuria anomochaeta]KAF2633485.1 hypothetical protein BU25DRAFT_405374 [Macroventuria anomochaeta]
MSWTRLLSAKLTTKNSRRPDLVRIGGASWDDLQKLGKRQLEDLDAAPDTHTRKLLSEVELPIDVFARVNCEEHRSNTGT